METLYTLCPKCETTFKLTASQLEAAGGVVRCGSCLHIFHAIEHTINSPSLDNTSEADTDSEWQDVLGDIPEDESWVMDLLADVELDDTATTPNDTAIKANRDESADLIEEETFMQAKHATDTIIQAPADTETPLEENILDIDEQTAVKPTAKHKQTQNKKATKKAGIDISQPLIQEERSTAQIEIEPDPIELPKPSPINGTAGLLLILLLVTSASLSAAWFYRVPLSVWPTSKPAVDYICQHINCQLPLVEEPLYTEGLIVRPHPDYDDALIMNVRLVNPGNKPARLPLLKLTIANVRGEVLAASAFEPENYLPDNLKGNNFQPANSAVEIELQLVEPAGGAVSYQMETLPHAN